MNDYIKREDALFALCSTVHFGEEVPCRNQIVSCQWNATRVQDYAESILSIPPADVAPVRRGEWIHERIESAESSIDFFLSATCECSLCRTFVQQESNYCPNCGAKMEAKDG